MQTGVIKNRMKKSGSAGCGKSSGEQLRTFFTRLPVRFCRSGILSRQGVRLRVPVTAGSRSYKEMAAYLQSSV
jgi:hypothetical protein